MGEHTYYRKSRSVAQRATKRKRSGSAAQAYVDGYDGPSLAAPPVSIGQDVEEYLRTPFEGNPYETGEGTYGYQVEHAIENPGPAPLPYSPQALGLPDVQVPSRVDGMSRDDRMRQQQFHYGQMMNEMAANPKSAANYDQFVKDMFNVMADMVEARDQALAEGRADVASQYDRQIADLQRQIAKARRGQDEGNAAYKKYRDKVDPLFAEHLQPSEASEAAEARIKERAESTLAGADEAQDEATSAFDDILVKIGADNIELASALHDEAASLDELGESFIVGAGDDAVELAALHSELIDKTVTSIKSQDKFIIESARVQLEKQFGARIDALKERQADVARDKADALANYTKKFNESYGDLPFGNPDEVWNFMSGSWAEREGWDFQHTMDVNAEVEDYWNGNVRSASEYRKAVTDAIFDDNIQQFAMDNGMFTADGKLDLVSVQLLASGDKTLERYLRGMGADYTRRIGNDQYKVNGLERYDQANRDAANLLDLRSKFVSNYGDLSREVDAFGTFEINPSNGWVSPVGPVGEYSNSFGYKKPESKGGHIHKGVDIYAPSGSYIYAPEGGKVIGVGTGNIPGNYIKILSDTGIVYYVAHMDGPSHLSKGDRVRAGASIGNVGNSGNARGTKPHAHFEMRKGDEWINPYTWLNAARDGGGTVSSKTYSYASGGGSTSTSTSTQKPGLT